MLVSPGGSRCEYSCPYICEGAHPAPAKSGSHETSRASQLLDQGWPRQKHRRSGPVSPPCTRCGHDAASPRESWCVPSYDLAFVSTPASFGCAAQRWVDPASVVRSSDAAGDCSHSVFRIRLRPTTPAAGCATGTSARDPGFATLRGYSCCALVTGYARPRSASEPSALRERTVHAERSRSPRRVPARRANRRHSACAAQREPSSPGMHHTITDPRMSSTSSTLREVGGDAPTPRRPRGDAERYAVRADAVPRPAATQCCGSTNQGRMPRGATSRECITRETRAE